MIILEAKKYLIYYKNRNILMKQNKKVVALQMQLYLKFVFKNFKLLLVNQLDGVRRM